MKSNKINVYDVDQLLLMDVKELEDLKDSVFQYWDVLGSAIKLKTVKLAEFKRRRDLTTGGRG